MHIQCNESLQQRNTLALQSVASAYVDVCNDADLQEALIWARANQKQIIPLGQGSNVVLAGDLDALVIHQCQRGIELLEDSDNKVVLKVAAGESWHDLVQWCLQQGYFGLENLALIPGTVGAAPIQNIGAYGVELASFIRSVSVIGLQDGQRAELSAGECEFAYRDSIFKQALRDSVIITSVELVLSKSPCLELSYPVLKNYLANKSSKRLTPQTIFDAVVDIRQNRLPDPLRVPNVGSFFKNPVVSRQRVQTLLQQFPDLPNYPQPQGSVKLPAAWLIDQCGWKGTRAGDIGVHPEHALVLVNYGCESGGEVLKLAQDIRQSVFASYGIDLEIEPRVYGLE